MKHSYPFPPHSYHSIPMIQLILNFKVTVGCISSNQKNNCSSCLTLKLNAFLHSLARYSSRGLSSAACGQPQQLHEKEQKNEATTGCTNRSLFLSLGGTKPRYNKRRTRERHMLTSRLATSLPRTHFPLPTPRHCMSIGVVSTDSPIKIHQESMVRVGDETCALRISKKKVPITELIDPASVVLSGKGCTDKRATVTTKTRRRHQPLTYKLGTTPTEFIHTLTSTNGKNDIMSYMYSQRSRAEAGKAVVR